MATVCASAAKLASDLLDDAVDLAGEPVDEPGLEAVHRRLADHRGRLGEVDPHQASGAGEERVHRDLDPRREHPAHVLPLRRDDVEVRGRPEVDGDARRAVAVARGDRVHDPVGADLVRVVVSNRDPGLRAGADDEDLRLRPALREELELAHERRHRRGEADAVDRVEVEHLPEQRAELVAGAAGVGGEPPLLGQPVAVVEAEDRLRVAHVDGQEHGAEPTSARAPGCSSPRRPRGTQALGSTRFEKKKRLL